MSGSRGSRAGERGFSLPELLIACAITTVIGGAALGLLASGTSIFARQPAVVDRQQSVRLAMDTLARDAREAAWFADGLDGVGGPGGGTTALDQVLLFAPKGDGEGVPVSGTAGGGLAVLSPPGAMPSCFGVSEPVLLDVDDGAPLPGWLRQDAPHGAVALLPAGWPFNDTLPAGMTPSRVRHGDLVAYRVAADADGVPSLWRSATGGYDAAGGRTAPPRAAWDLIARGIDDLQVQYRDAGRFDPARPESGWEDGPRVGVPTGILARTREVRLRLGARTIGERFPSRAELVVVVTPRPTLAALARGAQREAYR